MKMYDFTTLWLVQVEELKKVVYANEELKIRTEDHGYRVAKLVKEGPMYSTYKLVLSNKEIKVFKEFYTKPGDYCVTDAKLLMYEYSGYGARVSKEDIKDIERRANYARQLMNNDIVSY